MKKIRIQHLLKAKEPISRISVNGWVRTRRSAKDFSFIELNDGSSLQNMQVVVDHTVNDYETITRLTTGSAICVHGALIPSPGKGQSFEIKAESIDIYQQAPETYPLQKKRHTDEYLRSIAHLRPRTNKYGAMFRIRSELAYAIHHYFREKGFRYIHTPIITGSDCEGAGEMFRVSANTDGPDKNFFGAPSNLTVSGQLSAEMFSLALGDVYTFGPTFRAENSNTSRHAAEFWMVEPEMAFADIYDDMDLAEDFLTYLIRWILEHAEEDVALFAKFVDPSLMETLTGIMEESFIRLSYTEAIALLEKADRKFEYPIGFGVDLQSEHERYLTEVVFRKPVILYDYPKTIKPFYMRINDDDTTVAAMDVLVPRIGEIIGGSQREERMDILSQRMDAAGLSSEEYWWYLDSRRYGSAPHSGFGMGFERLMMLLTGVTNIRDVIPFPRTPGNIEF